MTHKYRLLAILAITSLVNSSPICASNEIASSTTSAACVEKREETDLNKSYTPLILPDDAAQRGISLSGDTKLYRVAQGQYHIGCGCVMVHTDEDVLMETCRASVYARSGATIVVSAKPDATRVLNLTDKKHDSVRVIFGKNHISLNPGEELVIANVTQSNVEKDAAEYVLRYRNAQTVSVSPEYKAVLFEFSLGDAMKHCLIFKQLTSSPKAEDKILLAQIIKTAAAVDTMFAKSRDKYTHGPNDPEAQPQKGLGFRIAFKKKQTKPARIATINAPASTED